MSYYAQLNENNICIGVSNLSGTVDVPSLIPLPEFDISLMGKKYSNGLWEEVESEPVPEPEPTEQELIQAEILLNQAEIIAKQNEHDEVLAEILLGQQEVAANV